MFKLVALTVLVYLFPNPFMSERRQIALVNSSFKQINQELHISLRPKIIIHSPDPCTWKEDTSWIINAFAKHDCLMSVFTAPKMRFISLPPQVIDGLLYFSGVSDGVCKKRGIAYSTAAPIWFWFVKQNRMSKAGIMHEMGHMLGATHTDSISVMNYRAYALSKIGLTFSNESKRQIRECIKKW